jgi:hypothetical protein
MCADLPTQLRYLNALQQLTTCPVMGEFARRTQRELIDAPIAEYLEHVLTLPPGLLLPEERRWRYVADNLSSTI